MQHKLSFKPVPFCGSHDPSATISCKGDIIAGAEEERFIRNKQAIGFFPSNAIEYCLDEAGVDFSDVELVVPYLPENYEKRNRDRFKESNSLKEKVKQIGKIYFEKDKRKRYKWKIQEELKKHFGNREYNLTFVGHHLSHAASAAYPSGFSSATVVTMDGKGEYDSTVVWDWKGEELERKVTHTPQNSLGFFYGVITEYLGYRVRNGAGKIMGLAPYGEQDNEINSKFDEMCKLTPDGYDVTDLSGKVANGSYQKAVEYFEERIGVPRRNTNGKITQKHKNIAYMAQKFLEEAAINVVKKGIEITEKNNVCISGGVALNCKMNKRIREMDAVNNVFVQPISSDAGLTIGASLETARRSGFDVISRMNNVYLGPKYDNQEVREAFENIQISYEKVDEPSTVAANKIANGKLVGWMQGKMEMGPRALGHRSILADPRDVESKNKVNKRVKHRENWRPFAPSILQDHIHEYFENAATSPFMIDTFDPVENKNQDMKAVLHPADDTTRPQTVTKDESPLYYELIEQFRQETGVPLVLNTSFNDSGEPIVNRPREAIKDFFSMGLDTLIINDFVIHKNG